MKLSIVKPWFLITIIIRHNLTPQNILAYPSSPVPYFISTNNRKKLNFLRKVMKNESSIIYGK